jgi:predicted negative regulator of RcsB-dependent stress response
MIWIVDTFREQRKLIALAAASIILIAVGIYFGVSYYRSRESSAQVTFGRGMAFYHAAIDPEAPDDPYGKGPQPVFRNDTARYEAASKEFSDVLSLHRSSKLGVLAQYYLGLSQLRLGQPEEAVKNLEVVRNNTRDLTIGYLAKKLLAQQYLDQGNARGAREILEGMVQDPQCDLPAELLRVELANAHMVLGNEEDALKLLREMRDQGQTGMFQSLVLERLGQLEAITNISGGDSSSEEENPAPDPIPEP